MDLVFSYALTGTSWNFITYGTNRTMGKKGLISWEMGWGQGGDKMGTRWGRVSTSNESVLMGGMVLCLEGPSLVTVFGVWCLEKELTWPGVWMKQKKAVWERGLPEN